MFGRNRRRLTEPERVGVIEAAVGTARFGLVGDKHHRLAAPAQHFGKVGIDRRQSALGVDDEKRKIRLVDCRFRLCPHPPLQAFRVGLFQTGRVDDRESQAH